MSNKANLTTAEGIRTWLKEELARRLNLDPRDIDTAERFNRYGLQSATATNIILDLSKALGRNLAPTLVWDHPSIDKVAEFLTRKSEDRNSDVNGAVASQEETRLSAGKVTANEPIAIVGMSCRFPRAANIAEYWELLQNGVDAIQEVPASRWSLDDFYSEDPSEPGKMSTRWGGFLDQVDRFDSGFFRISPREAIQMDPNQRLTLELCWEALEDAGVDIPALQDSLTGVYIGNIWNDYATLSHRGDTSYVQQHTATGSHYSIIANRVSYFLGLQGPSMTVDTACSSSLVSVHLACQALRNGEATMALAGGVNLIIAPDSTVSMSKFGAMAPDGRSKAFDHRANGYVRGEGAGVLVLKPLSAALASGDTIYSVIRGSAVNNDGPSNGLTAPNPASQRNVLEMAYKRAGVPTDRVHYIETHGTGTMLGDPIEANAIGAVLGEGRPKDKPLYIGSVKSNFGHLEGAAGVAGLIKLALSIKNRTLAPSLHYEKPNPHIPFEEIGVAVNTLLRPWPSDETAIGGVSSFGFGGTNCHVVLEEFPMSAAQLLPLSANRPAELQKLAREMQSMLKSRPEVPLKEFCYSGARNLAGGKERIAITASSGPELARLLAVYAEGRSAPGVAIDRLPAPPRVVFFCPGQGGQWLGMGRKLMRSEPVFRAKLEQCDEAIRAITGWSLLAELNAETAISRISNPEVDVIQPAIWAMQVAQAALWKSWGIIPDAVVGHSMGEVAAAYIAGMLSLDDAARVICIRSKLAKRASGQGGMAVVELRPEQCEGLIAPTDGRVSIASCNSPNSTVLAGDNNDLKKILDYLQSEEVFCRFVNVDFASHSSQMDPLLDELFRSLQTVSPRKGSIRLFSTVEEDYVDGRKLTASYWVKNLRNTVRFTQSIQKLLAEGLNAFVEMSPHPVLSAAVQQTVEHERREALILPSSRREEDERSVILESLGKLYAVGCNVGWSRLYSGAQGDYQFSETILKLSRPLPPETGPGERTNGDLLLVSARSPEALKDYALRMREYIHKHEGVSVKDLSYTTSVKRPHHEFRLAVVGRNRDELLQGLKDYADGEEGEQLVEGRTEWKPSQKLAFVFTGQGAQWFSMGRELMQVEPIFRHKLEEIDETFQRYAPWSIVAELLRDKNDSRIMETEIAQPAIFALQVALAEMWKHWSVEPGAVLGHSVGEVAAAHTAGLLSLDDACSLIRHRGRFMQQATGLGKMAHVALTEEALLPYLQPYNEDPKNPRVGIAAYNSPSSTVLSGERDALEKILASLGEKNIYCKMLPVDYAFHSPQMEPYKEALSQAVVGITAREGTIPFYSTVKGTIASNWELDAKYWGDNIRQPVRFVHGVEALIEDGFRYFVEVGPHPALGGYLRETLEAAETFGHVTHSLIREKNERANMLRSLASLYVRGYPVRWNRMHRQGGAFVKLPHYPWQRERYWIDSNPAGAPGAAAVTQLARRGHIFLGERLRSSLPDLQKVIQYEAVWDDRDPYMLKDHILFDMVVVPGAAHISLILLGASEALQTNQLLLENSEFMQALVLPESEPRYVQLTLSPEGDGTYAVQTASLAVDGSEDEWTIHAIGRIRTHQDAATETLGPDRIEAIKAGMSRELTQQEYYQNFLECGYVIGEKTFQWVHHAWRKDGETLALMKKPHGVTDVNDYLVFPGFHDAMYHAVTSSFPRGLEHYVDENTIYVPWGNTEAKVYGEFEEEMWLHIVCHESLDSVSDAQEVFRGDLTLYNRNGEAVYAIKGWVLKRVSSSALLRSLKKKLPQWTYQVDWREKAAPALPASPGQKRWIVIEDQGSTAAALAEELRTRGHGADVFPPDASDYASILKTGGPYAGIIYAAGMNLPDVSGITEFSTANLQDQVLGDLGSLIQLLSAAVEQESIPRVYILTRNCIPLANNSPVQILQAPLWGLGRVAAVELPDTRTTLIDIGPGPADQAPAETAALAIEILADEEELEVRLHGASRNVSRLQRLAPGNDPDLELKPDGAYLVTGGLGGLGLRIAAWLADHGARNIILTARREPDEHARSVISELESQGVQIQTLQGDVADSEAVERMFAAIQAPVRGVIHAAGALKDGALLKMDRAQMQAVLDAKLKGAYNLHRATQALELDFFLLFSSVAGLLGSPGQANYAAGNAFLDALAHWRRQQGLPAQTINWGPWQEVGMAAALGKRRSERGYPRVGMIDVSKGMDLMGSLLKQGITQSAVLAFDWGKYVEEFPTVASVPMLFELIEAEAGQAAEGAAGDRAANGKVSGGGADESAIVAELRQTPAAQRREKLQEHVADQVARVLGLPPGSAIDVQKGFFTLGLDSLMAVEVRNRLQKSFQVKLGNTMIFDHPTTEALTEYLYEDVLSLDEAAEENGQEEANATRRVDSSSYLSGNGASAETLVDTMSDEEAEAELLRELSELEGN